MTTKPAVCGIDFGASESYVAYVGKGIVDIVQNEVSKRATPSLTGFNDRERLLGDVALAQIRSNAKNTCRNFKHLLGRKLESPDLQNEHFWSTSALCECDDGFAGYSVTYKGEARQMTSTQCTAMFLTKLREISEKWCQAKVQDVVIAVPSSFCDVQRQAVLDAAQIAGLNILRVMNEHTATALAYGIYRSNDFDPEKPMTVAFCSMGHSIFSVSIVQFVRGKLHVLSETSDRVGGRDMDECLMREFAAQFQKKVGCDPLSNKKSAFKLEDAVTKCKKVLSANSEANMSVECLMEDEDFHSQIGREDFEKKCAPLMERCKAVLQSAIKASEVPLDQIDSVEIVGGGSRVPWVKRLCSEAFGGKGLSTTMNQEESVARGCALQAAILSPLYKVRDFDVKDVSPFGVSISWLGLGGDTPPMDGAEKEPKEENGEKKAVLFPAGSQMNTVKMLTFYRKEPFDLSAEFTEDAPLLPMTPRSLGKFRVELPQQTEKKKVKVKARLTLHGTFTIDSAQMVEEEEVEEIVREKRELPPEPEEVKETKAKTNGTVPSPEGAGQPPDADAPDAPDAPDGAAPEAVPAEATADAATAPPAPAENGAKTMETETSENVENAEDETKEADGNGDAKEEKEKDETMEEETLEPAPPPKRMEPRFEWVEVVKKRKLTKTSDLRISATGRPGLSPEILQQRQDEETQMQAEMREIIETDERKNDLEGYIFNARAKIGDGGDWVPFIAPDDRQKFEQELQKAEDWLFDHFDGTKIQFIDKLDELKALGDPVQSRCKESGSREEVLRGVRSNVSSYRQVAAAPGERYGHIASEKLEKILAACQDFESWLNELQQKQEAMPKYQKPILTCTEMEKRSQELAKTADEILREPKPKEEPKEIHLDEKDEKEVELLDEEKAVDEKEEPAKGDEPRDMEVD